MLTLLFFMSSCPIRFDVFIVQFQSLFTSHGTISCSAYSGNVAFVLRLAKIAICTTVKLFKGIPRVIIGLACHNRKSAKKFIFLYAYFHIRCITCYTLCMQWLIFRTILLSSDVEINPGPDTLDLHLESK